MKLELIDKALRLLKMDDELYFGAIPATGPMVIAMDINVFNIFDGLINDMSTSNKDHETNTNY